MKLEIRKKKIALKKQMAISTDTCIHSELKRGNKLHGQKLLL